MDSKNVPQQHRTHNSGNLLGALGSAADVIAKMLDERRVALTASGLPLRVTDELSAAAGELCERLAEAKAHCDAVATASAPDWLRSLIDGIDHDGGELP